MAKPWSLLELLRSTGRAKREVVEAIPESRRLSTETEAALANKLPTEALEELNRRQFFGKTPKGEPLRGVIRPRPGREEGLEAGRLPKAGTLSVVPESMARKAVKDFVAGESPMGFRKGTLDLYMDLPLTVSTARDLDQLKRAGQPSAQVVDIDALGVSRGMGPAQYRAMYELINAGGDVNASSILTDVNKLRRLGHVGPLHLGGNPRGIVPISEHSYLAKGSKSQQLFNQPVYGGYENQRQEFEALADLFGGQKGPLKEAMALAPKDLRGLDPDTIAGLLYAREAQLAKTYGAQDLPRMADIGDFGALSRMSEPIRRSGEPDTIYAGIGPHTLGRAATTQEILRRVMRGEEAEEAADAIVRAIGPDTSGMRGRYAKGGLASVQY